ncbi:MAG: hypothetical protein LBN30_02330 [Oscillospiraceae bacterium]|jgi:cyclic beta-1,2-glucan synthetase|nr:hypothetical protein [Oscillospiraceae bacterium]
MKNAEISVRGAARRYGRELEAVLTAAERFAGSDSATNADKSGEWLLDNRYLAEREGKTALMDLRAARRLPRGKISELYIADYAAALLKSCDFAVTEDALEGYLNQDFEYERPPRECELYLLPTILKLELVAELRRGCDELECGRGDARVFERVFTSLRFLASFDTSRVLARCNRLERILLQDPAGVYGEMDDDTRADYRREVARLARVRGMDELAAAEKVAALASSSGEHVGCYIFERPLGMDAKSRTGVGYIWAVVSASVLFAVIIGVLLKRVFPAFLLLLPITETVKNIADRVVLRVMRPNRVPRLELENGVPHEGRTLAVTTVLLTSEESGVRAARLLEEFRLANRDAGANLMFGLLCDFAESKNAEEPTDSLYLQAAEHEIAALNEKYAESGGGFFLLWRERVLNERDGVFAGHERKRGAVLELCKLLRGKGNMRGSVPRDVRFLIVLDADTRLRAGTAKALIGAMLHPLNRVVMDTNKHVVVRGSAILQPRVSVGLAASIKTEFARLFAGQGGVDPYGGASGDVYQNMVGKGSFTGKGILDVDAYLSCLDERFPENTILSHDLLEGAYLRCGFAGDIELTDGFPSRVLPYYARLHRWVRGDWQTAPWLLPRVPGFVTRERNPLSAIDRWKIADNLRRSLVPVATIISLLVGLTFMDAILLTVSVIAAAMAVSELLVSSVTTAPHRRVRYISFVLSGFGGRLARTLTRLVLLPFEAWTCASAIVTALFRMVFTKRKMLEWVTAADSELLRRNGLWAYFGAMLPVVATSVIVAVLSPRAPTIAVAIVWGLTPIYAWAIGREHERASKLGNAEKQYLQGCAVDIWRYFEDFWTAGNNWLPPDNFQEQPSVGLATRTSPTNIGLAMLSALAAYDLGICSKEVIIGKIGNTLSALERLPKWHGHIYNWYDTETLAVLAPAYVSTVDSGNLAACLIAVREGLIELGENAIAARANRLMTDMVFTPLYDAERHLFRIGYDVDAGKLTDGCYDLLASEAMQASYVAIAKGDVPRRHWRALSRALVSRDGYRGMASWTGTMFEYMMPTLLLPIARESLSYETMKFCVYAHKRESRPWGMSESAYYAFDNVLGYQYKAHGVGVLAMKRGMELDRVIAPYASFLALPMDARGAVRNLAELEKMGVKGKYGHYDAIEFTQSRLRGRDYEVVKTYMVHHLGMSMVAIANELCGSVMRERFARDKSMAAYAELMEERIPVGGVVLKSLPREESERPARAGANEWSFATEGCDAFLPRCTLLSNGAYGVTVFETGRTFSEWRSLALTRLESEAYGRGAGVAFYLRVGEKTYSLLPAPEYDDAVSYSSRLTGACATVTAKVGGIETAMTVSVPDNDAGELREVSIMTDTVIDVELYCCFEPVLSRVGDYRSHPSFQKLSIETSIIGDEYPRIVISRRPRARGGRVHLAFGCDAPFTYDTSREVALGRGKIDDVGESLRRKALGTVGAVLDPCVCTRVKLSLKVGEVQKVRFALAPGRSEDAALRSLERILCSLERPHGRLDDTARRLGLTAEQTEFAMARLSELVNPSPYREIPSERYGAIGGGLAALWSLGVSGDNALTVSVIKVDEEILSARTLILEHAFLTELGAAYDLLFLVDEGGEYMSPLRDGLLQLLRELRLEHRLSARGGVHIASLSAPAAATALAVATRVEGETAMREHIAAQPLAARKPARGTGAEPQFCYREDGSFAFEVDGALPQNAWSHVLANREFGFLATDAGTGHMWHLNARENRINAWINDSLATRGPETLTVSVGGENVSCFADRDGYKCEITNGFGFAVWEKQIGELVVKTMAFVPPEGAMRVLIVETSEPCEVVYCTDVALSGSELPSVNVITECADGVISAKNPYNTDYSSVFSLAASERETAFTCAKASFMRGDFDVKTGAGFPTVIAAKYFTRGTLVLVTGCEETETVKSCANEDKARELLAQTKDWWREITSRVTVRTPSENLNRYMNGWAVYQTLCCRVFARTSLYQSGGAFGFRDQLQDVCALIAVEPKIAQSQLLLACEHQFEEGDVQHWWHPKASRGTCERGVRTRCSDDLLWLVYALCEYTEKTGDLSLAHETARYIASPPLDDDEQERYEQPMASEITESVYEHCRRAINLVLARGAGKHGLCLIGGGDWNDGMNLVGAGGAGESVWLTWFFAHTARRFAKLCVAMGDGASAERYGRAADAYSAAANAAWDGDWFLRGWYDDGKPLGSATCDECRIDSIAQSFAVLGGGETDKVRTALDSATRLLFDRENRVVKLFDPPFSDGDSSPGYIKGYSPGFRENGGQYTHGAVWLAMGLLLTGKTDEGYEMLETLLPQGRKHEVYRVEPYVLAADVYSNAAHMGRGGWTWYTGAAGWYHRVVLENLLGIRLENGELTVKPNLPSSWDGYTVRVGEREAEITVKNGRVSVDWRKTSKINGNLITF